MSVKLEARGKRPKLRTKPRIGKPRPDTDRAMQDRTVETRQRILTAAVSEFAKHGFEGASTREIARLAGIPNPLINYHFGNKEALWRASALYAFDVLNKEVDKAVSLAKAEDRMEIVRVSTRALLEVSFNWPEFIELVNHESRRKSPRLKFLIENVFDHRFRNALIAIEDAQAKGQIPAGDPIMFYVVIADLAVALSLRAGQFEMLSGRKAKDRASMDEYWAIIEALLFRR